MPILLHALVAAGYLAVAMMIGRAALRGAAERPPATSVARAPGDAVWRSAVAVAWVLHAFLLRDAAVGDGSWRFGFALALSATMWLVVALFWIQSLFESLAGLWLVVLPLAALCALLPLWFPGSAALGRISGADSGEPSPWLPLHLVVALAAYGLLTIAAVHAIFMAALDRRLHGAHADRDAGADGTDPRRGRLRRAILGTLPPLLTMERILFRLIGTGFVLLTLTVVSGVFFSETLFGKPLRIDHKTVFSLIAWLTFGALLVGRVMRGWRGRLALSWTLSGFAILFLAYAGSRFVLEVILHRV